MHVFFVVDVLEFELLGKQDSSRLPFGFLEKFAFAGDRRKLINSSGSNNNDNDGDEKKGGETHDGEQLAISNSKSDLVDGSEEHTYYSMLQIENEIEQCYKKMNCKKQEGGNSELQSKLRELRKEFLTWIVKVETKDVKITSYDSYPLLSGRVKRLVSRYWIRELPNLNVIDRKKAIKVIKDTCNPYCRHSKPHSYQSGSHVIGLDDSKEERGPKYSVKLTLDELHGKCTKRMDSDYEQLFDATKNKYNSSMASKFSEQSLHWIFEKCNKDFSKFTSQQITNIFNSFSNIRLMFNGAILVNAIGKQIERSFLTEKTGLKKNERPCKFGDSTIHRKLTISEMDKLSDKYKDLWKNDVFLDEYLKKMLPSSMLKYRNEKWNVIPKNLRLSFLLKLYEWVINCINSGKKLNEPTHNTIKGFILWKYIYFIWKNYVCFVSFVLLESNHFFSVLFCFFGVFSQTTFLPALFCCWGVLFC